MSALRRGLLAVQAARQLGIRQAMWYACYQVALHSGWLRRTPRRQPVGAVNWQAMRLPRPDAVRALLSPAEMAALMSAADEIAAGQMRLFGAAPRPLLLALPGELQHWTRHDTAATLHALDLPDVKYLWEPARFGWVFPLGRAYHLTENPHYARAFWEFAETFWDSNPAERGPNWESAQEVALRLMALAWGGACFGRAPDSTPARMARLAVSLAEHARRIPPTLAYARAQNNNHLLSEAAGLLTAAALLPAHPQARRWQALGRKWWRWGLRHQIFADGAYIQHSTNYHRLMLQLCLWVMWLTPQAFTPRERAQAASATRWLLAQCEHTHGAVPNLGPNDGAYLFPLSGLPFEDYRPVLQAAAGAFLGESPFPPGAWDEMRVWFSVLAAPPVDTPAPGNGAYLRAVRFTSRPGHADQLHFDLHYAGRYLLLDPGTYLYNAPPPWENALTHAACHNTITIDGQDQMTRAGRFLYLDWAQGEVLTRQAAPDGSWRLLRARHTGYRRLGIIHQRTLRVPAPGRWVVEDALEGDAARRHVFRLHWLVADGQWTVDDRRQIADDGAWQFSLHLPDDGLHLRLCIRCFTAQSPTPQTTLSLVRAGELLYGEAPADPVRGWFSPTYGVKIPALSLAIHVESAPPLHFTTEISVAQADG
ncbi:MAG: alginate lyase family protein [Anaerolineales bacterium]